MKKLIVILFFLTAGIHANAQKIRFDYDSAGNQYMRTLCISCPSKTSDETINDYSTIQEDELQQFFPEDVISYYPNPVKNELFLKWEVNEKRVTGIEIHSINGQILKKTENINSNSNVLSFEQYPNGIYIVSLLYNDGDNKTIKIIKE